MSKVAYAYIAPVSGLSLDAQRQRCRDFFENSLRGFKWHGVASDTAADAAKPIHNRPAWSKLIRTADEGDVAIVPVMRLLGRRPRDLVAVERPLGARGVGLAVLDLGIVSWDPIGRQLVEFLDKLSVAIKEMNEDAAREATAKKEQRAG